MDEHKMSADEARESITKKGNPKKPEGEAGRMMLDRMNESHAGLTLWALSFVGFEEGDSVLDIGCGGGAALRRISGMIKSGHLSGVDYSEVSVELSRENNADDIAAGKAEIICASVEALPFPDSAFDKIITVESFYFWPHPADDLCEVYRVLKPGGSLLIALDVYNGDHISKAAAESIEKYELFAPTEGELRSMLEDAGFSSVELHTEEGSDRIAAVGRK